MKDGAHVVSVRPLSEHEHQNSSIDRRAREVLRIAEALFNRNPDWVTFFREILGVDGVVPRLYPEVEDMQQFERSEANAQVQFMLTRLRERRSDQNQQREPQRMITVRLPAVVHDALRAEAGLRAVSMNQLCISKLMQLIDVERVPATQGQQQEDAEVEE